MNSDEGISLLCMTCMRGFNEQGNQIIQVLIASVLNVHEKCRDKLLSTPGRLHYSFNQRDMWRVFQGICSGSPRNIVGESELTQLWRHELNRVYGDRLINSADRTQLMSFIGIEAKNFNFSEDFSQGSTQIFCNFVDKDRNYVACSITTLKARLESFQ